MKAVDRLANVISSFSDEIVFPGVIELALAEMGYQLVPKEPTQDMLDAGLRATAAYLDLEGSQLTVNRSKMRLRYRAMLKVVD